MFSDNYIALCAKNGEHVSAVAEKLGFSRSAGVKWANGSTPRKSTLKRIADFFGVTVNELINENPAPTNEDGLDAAILAFLHSLPVDRVRGLLLALEAPTDVLDALDRGEW